VTSLLASELDNVLPTKASDLPAHLPWAREVPFQTAHAAFLSLSNNFGNLLSRSTDNSSGHYRYGFDTEGKQVLSLEGASASVLS
jgi:hypothetical protein